VSGFRSATKVEQVFSIFARLAAVGVLALPAEPAYVFPIASVTADAVLSPTCRKGMKMTPSTAFTIHAGTARVRTHLQSVKRWQGFCLGKRM